MPVHDWSRVEAWLFHDFHHSWIAEIGRALNGGVLPGDFYALVERRGADFRLDATTPTDRPEDARAAVERGPRGGSPGLAEPRVELTAETDMEFYRRKQSIVAVRHVTGDRVVAVVEVVSPSNKNNRHGVESFVRKAAELLDQGIHLLILDLIHPGPRDPGGIHGLIWDFIAGADVLPPERPLALAAYEADLATRAYVVPLAVGDALPDMPLFLAPRACVEVPLEATYRAAVAAFPRRWRHLLERPSSGAS